MKLSYDADSVLILGKKIRLVFRPVVSKDEYLRGAYQIAVYWRPDHDTKWLRMNSHARSIVPPVAFMMQPDFFVVQSRVGAENWEAQHSFTVHFEQGAHDDIALVASTMMLASLEIYVAIEKFEAGVKRPATEREIEGIRVLFVSSMFKQIANSEGVASLADKQGQLYFPEESDLYQALANKLMANAYAAAAEQRTPVLQNLYALMKDDDKPISLPGGSQGRDPEVSRVVDGVRVEGQHIRVELHQAGNEKKESWGSLQVAAWKKVEGAGATSWEPLNNPAETIAPVWSFICTDEALVIHDTQGKGRPEYDEIFTVLLEPGMGQALAAAGLQLIVTSMASTETLKTFSQYVKRPPTAREMEAVRVLLAKYFVDRVDPDKDMTMLADEEGKPYFPQEEPLIAVLVGGNVLPQIFDYAVELTKTVIPQMRVYQPQGGKGLNFGHTLH